MYKTQEYTSQQKQSFSIVENMSQQQQTLAPQIMEHAGSKYVRLMNNAYSIQLFAQTDMYNQTIYDDLQKQVCKRMYFFFV